MLEWRSTNNIMVYGWAQHLLTDVLGGAFFLQDIQRKSMKIIQFLTELERLKYYIVLRDYESA